MAAFTRVSAFRNLQNDTPNGSVPQTLPTASAQNDIKPKFPPGVRAWVGRALDDRNTMPDVSRSEIEVKLRAILNTALVEQRIDQTDWDNHPLPQAIIRQERLQNVGTATSNAFDPASPPSKLQALSNTNTNKRKSSEISDAGDKVTKSSPSMPPWRASSVNSANSIENRLSMGEEPPPPQQQHKAEKRQKAFHESKAALKQSSKFNGDLERRRQRFNVGVGSSDQSSSRGDSPSSEIGSRPVIGTCQALEKRYLRLTAAPKPELVRPLPVLRRALDMLKKKWVQEHNYNYICDQFKSLRQDLTVQHVTNEFTITVYETHARIALEKGDLGEYNQCQTQLRALYRRNLGGHPGEFLAYRILYLIYTGNRTDMNGLLAELTSVDLDFSAVRHALQLRSALAQSDYIRFFKLYLGIPHVGAYLADMFINRERIAALAHVCKAYKPDVPLRFITDYLSFESEQLCIEFLKSFGGDSYVENKDGVARFSSAKAGSVVESARVAANRGVDIKGQI